MAESMLNHFRDACVQVNLCYFLELTKSTVKIVTIKANKWTATFSNTFSHTVFSLVLILKSNINSTYHQISNGPYWYRVRNRHIQSVQSTNGIISQKLSRKSLVWTCDAMLLQLNKLVISRTDNCDQAWNRL